MGSGLYAQKLPYADWLIFNNSQRAHLNYVEVLAPFALISLASGLFNAKVIKIEEKKKSTKIKDWKIRKSKLNFSSSSQKFTFYFIVLFLVARFFYAIGYSTLSGAKNPLRITGALLADVAIVAK